MALEKVLRPLASTLVRKVGERAVRGKPFYSNVDQAIANITQGTGTGAQMLAELMKTKGVAKELKDRPAIKKTLEANKDAKVTKADLEQLAAENPAPQVQHRESDTREFEQWQMPGGENHRNILLRLPNPAAERNAQIAAQIRDLYQGIGWSNQHMAKFPHLSVDEIPRIAHSEQEIARLRKELAALPRTPDMYEGPHFGEKNVLAHARVADYYDKGKKILLIDEIQSDWHQAARDARKDEIKRLMKAEGIDKETASKRVPKEFGYAMPETQRLKGVAQPDDQGGYKVVWEDGTFSGGYSKEGAEAKALEGKSNAMSGVVPDAPFKQNWHELVIKRLLDDAARNGYDRVVITPGAEQAKRYDLSKQISRVVYSPTTETLNAFDNSGKSVLMKSGITPEHVEDYIGKEPAKRLLDPQNTKSYLRGGKEDSYHEITGEDLQVGGEGMTGFYDQILPSYLNDYGKRYGVQVGTYEMPVGEKMIPDRAGLGMIRSGEQEMAPFHSFDITPQMREDITTKGVPLYQAAPPVAIGAGAMQEEQPAEYAGGGIIKKAAKALSKVEALRLTKERELIEPTDYLSARAIEPPHEVRDTEKLNLLIKSMKENGWQGRPILTYDAGRGDEALTGSHRIKAATQADIEVPIYRIENAGDYVDKNGKSIFDVGFMEPEDQVKWLNQFGDKNAAKLLEQEPELKSTKYAGGGIIKKAGQVIGKAAQSSGMARPVTATKDLTTLQDFHTSLGDRIRERVAERQNLIESMPFKYDKGQRVFTEDSARKNRLPYEILDRTLYGNKPMRADHPVLGPGMGAVIKDPETGKAVRTPYEAGYRVRSEGPEGWQEYVLPETAIKGDVEMAKGGRVTNDAMWMAVQNKQLRKKHGN